MGFYRGPQIVTSGLIMSLDAGNTKSYTGTGTAWYDRAVNLNAGVVNNGTLINSPTFDSANKGSVVFNGTNQYVSCGNGTNLQITVGSVNFWFKGVQQGSTYNGIVVKQNAWGVFIYQSKLQIYDWGNAVPRDTGINVSDNVWRNVCLTFTQTVGTPSNNALIYVNGVLSTTTTIQHSDNNNSLLLAYGNLSPQYLQGSISQTLIYNRVLTATEVLQNYNATKSRFT